MPELNVKPIFPNYMEMRPRVPQLVWRMLRMLTLASVLAVCYLLFIQPEIGLSLFWGILIPIFPLMFLLAPGLWRNICPMAALNQTPRASGFSHNLNLSDKMKHYSNVVGIALFLLIVPARKVLFQHNGSALVLLILAMLLGAFIGGIIFTGKSGWCSSVCPLLPVQRLYGQTPFLTVRNSHCNPCVGCAENCYDFNPSIAYLSDIYGDDRHFGSCRKFFAGAFPGLIFAFYTLPDPPTITTGEMYARFAVYILVSVGSFYAFDSFFRTSASTIPTLYAALALNLYYWFTFPVLHQHVAEFFNIAVPGWLIWLARSGVLAVTAIWIVRTHRKELLFIARMLPAVPARVGTSRARIIQSTAFIGWPAVTFTAEGKSAEVEPGRTLLETMEMCDLNAEAGCRMGVCGADPVAILKGMDNLSPVGSDERATLQRLGLAENTRMACRARVYGPVSVSLSPERRHTPGPITIADFRYNRSVKQVVIIGNGIAGVTAADHIRRRHPTCVIHLVGRERYPLYNRMGISRLIYGRSAMQGLYLLPESWYDEYGITSWLNTHAVGINPKAGRVSLATGESLPYDRAILAMGSSSFVPPIEGFGLEGTFVLREAADAMDIRAFAQEHEARHVVVAGGGVLGIEAATALHKFGLHVVVLEYSDRLLSRQLDKRSSQLLREHLERIGLEILLKAETAKVFGPSELTHTLREKPALQEFFRSEAKRDEGITQVLLTDGRTIPADLLLVCAGIQPNIELAQHAGLQVNKGVVVDDALRTSVPDIFAVGDLAEHRGQIIGLWPAAVEQAEVAAINALGGHAVYTGTVPVTTLKGVGIDLTSIGRFKAESDHEIVIVLEEIVGDTDERRYRKLVISHGKIVGAILLGHPIQAPLVAAAIMQRISVMPCIDALQSGDWNILGKLVRD